MKLPLLALLLCANLNVSAGVEKLGDFELTDQHDKPRTYRFPKLKVTVMTLADHQGSGSLAPWIQHIHDRYEQKIDVDGVADVSMIPKPFHNMFRSAFRKQLKRSVMLDWSGEVVKQFHYEKGVPNIFVIDREGRIVAHASGGISDDAMRKLTREIDRAMEGEAR
jgi:hypothetical protein